MEKYVNELKIGNLVHHYPGLEPAHSSIKQPRFLAKITALFEDGAIKYKIIEKHSNAHHNSIEPIPLTEEWLIKFGFENSNMGFSADYSKDNIELNFVNGLYEYGDYCKIEYVHKLQNLYFALTGEELTLK